MADVTVKIEQLIRLATDPGAAEEEARTAALSACRLIKRHDLVVSARGSVVLPPPTPPPPATTEPVTYWTRPQTQQEEQNWDGALVIIEARYSGFCTRCHKWFPRHAKIAWAPAARRVAMHFKCMTREEAATVIEPPPDKKKATKTSRTRR